MTIQAQFANLAAALDEAARSGSFTTLATALDMAQLVENAGMGGPFTVFAPIDEAFAQLPAEELATLLSPDRQELLTAVLGYHVLPSVMLAQDIQPGEVQTVTGETLTVAREGNTLLINDARVVQADIVTGNGVVHVIDRVLLPALAG